MLHLDCHMSVAQNRVGVGRIKKNTPSKYQSSQRETDHYSLQGKSWRAGGLEDCPHPRPMPAPRELWETLQLWGNLLQIKVGSHQKQQLVTQVGRVRAIGGCNQADLSQSHLMEGAGPFWTPSHPCSEPHHSRSGCYANPKAAPGDFLL